MMSQSFSRRVAAVAPRVGVRALSSTAVRLSHTPSMGDIHPSAASIQAFNDKQRDFREHLVEAQKERGARALAAQKSTDSSSASSDQGSSKTDAGATAEAKSNEPERKQGPLTNLIYGTKEGREMEAQIEASFSQVLARGKYVHSIVFHEVKPDTVDEYVKLVGEWYPKMANTPENKVHLVGSWRTEVGDCDTFVHIWEYQKYEGYHESRHSISQHPQFNEFNTKLSKLINSKKVSLMQEFSFWPTTPPRNLGGIFELRSYTLHPGNLLEWETHWRRGLKARREVMEGVGAWFVQIGELNTVHHLWQFANLEERRSRREKSWSIQGWSDTVHKTVPLIQSMQSRILIPMPWSPVA
ncbi:Protein NipSnap-like protein [Cladobotryum mycophilum]|uniref:Protein NipSnap-like protein n=1 Tax=Cladobotryum mycophilum TaxID=491253 RepID=A0ABR0SH25_9HYPO